MFGKTTQAKPYRPQFATNSIFDIMSGRYELGCKGEWILNGGVANIEGFTGPGNSFKTTFALFRMLSVLNHYPEAKAFFYDTESSASLGRLKDLANNIDPTGKLADSLEEDQQRFSFTSIEYYNGSEWFDLFKGYLFEKIKGMKPLETPFLDIKENKPYSILPPFVGGIDSYSMFQSGAVFKKSEKGSVGESDLNAIAMTNSNAKDQLLAMLPGLTAKANALIFMTAHMGEQIVMDQYNAPKKKLWTVTGNKKMKKVPESFTFLTNNLYEVVGLTPLLNKGDKKPEFPISKDDCVEGDTDLIDVTLKPVRTKYGLTGLPMKFIVSQREGFKPELTNYWFVKNLDRFGLSDNAVNQRLDLMPDFVFTRNNIRDVIKQNPRFNRALHILMELCYMKHHWHNIRDDIPTPKELYEGMIKLGYSWDDILDTRSYWTFDQYTNPTKYLSTRDLLDIYHGRKKPYWMT